jgi:hypothetical protein
MAARSCATYSKNNHRMIARRFFILIIASHLGKGTFIYVQGNGVAYKVEYARGLREFPQDQVGYMQTEASTQNGEARDADDEKTGHTTNVASAALGQRFGIAKKATLFSAKSLMPSTDALASIKDICFDIENNPGRAKKSVVVWSWGIRHEGYDMDEYDDMADDLEDAMLPCLEAGVPIVLASGNGAQPGKTSMDSLPQTMDGPKFPLIIVGNSDKNGNRHHQSEDGRGLTIYAPGVDVRVSDKLGKEQVVTGTSICKCAHHTKPRKRLTVSHSGSLCSRLDCNVHVL